MTEIEKIIRASTLLGIVAGLFEGRMGQLLGRHGVTYSQFALLNHLGRHQHLNESVSDLVKVMEMNQPGVTKAVQKLTRLGFVEVRKDEADARKKWVSITPSGLQQINAVMQDLGPDIMRWFEEWESDEMDTFIAHLEKISYWLDANRLSK